jgi:hypothetical protein
VNDVTQTPVFAGGNKPALPLFPGVIEVLLLHRGPQFGWRCKLVAEAREA